MSTITRPTPQNPRIFGCLADPTHEDLIRRGFESVISVVANFDTTEIEVTDRAEAFSIARTFVNAFEGDPEAADFFNVQVQKTTHEPATWMITRDIVR